ncbi:MAG: nucleotidyltransferase domain-containing protein [Candidatus Rokuibacteriota bacterium]
MFDVTTSLDDLLGSIAAALQLTELQYREAQEIYTEISRWIEQDPEIQRLAPQIYPQGSLVLGTTCKPKGRQEFDLDFVCELRIDFRLVDNPVILLNLIEKRLRTHPRFGSQVSRENRCIRVRLANRFHLDVVPACPDTAMGNDCIFVPDREAGGWKPSNPRGYRQWFEGRSELVIRAIEARELLPSRESYLAKAPLKRGVQIVKRWRDTVFFDSAVREFAPASCILTTLAGESYRGEISLSGVVSSIIEGMLSAASHSSPPVIVNPANSKEIMNERWLEDPRSYRIFSQKVQQFSEDWARLQKERGLPRIAAVLRHLFGEELTDTVLSEKVRHIGEARKSGALGIAAGSGFLTIGPGIGVTPVRANTFYGDR